MKKIFLTLFIAASAVFANAQHKSINDSDDNIAKATEKGWNIRLSAGYLIGGTSPLPLPVEIRSINGFNPGLNFMIEGDAEKKFNGTAWGLKFGIRFDTKGMTTDATTKNYHMEMSDGGAKVVGSLIHAHPYRRRSYISNEAPPRLDLVDGIEVYNAGNGPCDGDRLALVIAGIVGCIQTAGSDLHNVSSAKLGQAGIVFNRRVRDSRDFVQALQQNVCGYMVGGDIVPQIRESNLM